MTRSPFPRSMLAEEKTRRYALPSREGNSQRRLTNLVSTPLRRRWSTAGSMKVAESDVSAIRGRQKASALQERSLEDRPQELGCGAAGRRIEDGDSQGLPQTLEEWTMLAHAVGHCRSIAGPDDSEDGKVVGGSGIGHTTTGVQNPPWQPSRTGSQRPSPAVAKIDERETCRRRSDEPVSRTDGPEKLHGVTVAAQQKMSAVVDRAAEPGINEGPASPTGLRGRFMDDHVVRLARQRHCGRIDPPNLRR